MANLVLNNFYGADFSYCNNIIHGISLQFHITAKCDQKCKHCYMYESKYYKNQIQNPLTKSEMLQLIDEYCAFLNIYQCKGHIALSGGDPILSPNFWDILEHIHKNYARMCVVSILGNPYHITNQTAAKMKKLGVRLYQISIDGLQPTHDYFRKPGSFDASLKALRILHGAGINTTVSFTLSKLNSKDLLPLYDFLDGEKYIDGFGFGRLVPTGNAKELKDTLFSPEEYRKFLFEVFTHILSKERRMIMTFDDQMWRPMLFDLGLVDPLPNAENRKCVSGCMCGTGTVSILADGTMFPCRRMECAGGKFPEQSFKELFVGNQITKMFRNYDKYEGCVSCELFKFCRGCPAIKYATTGNFYAREPNCWRGVNNG